jgi:hypothetical protein
MINMHTWLEERFEEKVLTQRMYDKILLFVGHVSTNLPQLSLAYLSTQPNMTLSQKVTSRCVQIIIWCSLYFERVSAVESRRCLAQEFRASCVCGSLNTLQCIRHTVQNCVSQRTNE